AGGLHDQRKAVQQLLDDADVHVRLRTALALLAGQEKAAVPALIQLLVAFPAKQGWKAEEALLKLARARAARGSARSEVGERERYRDLWIAWWSQNRETVRLLPKDELPALLGFTLVIEPFDQARQGSRVLELDYSGRIRWQIEGLQYVTDAQSLPGDR